METSGPITVKGFATIDNVALINVEVRLQTRQQSCLATAPGGLRRSAALGLQSGCDSSPPHNLGMGLLGSCVLANVSAVAVIIQMTCTVLQHRWLRGPHVLSAGDWHGRRARHSQHHIQHCPRRWRECDHDLPGQLGAQRLLCCAAGGRPAYGALPQREVSWAAGRTACCCSSSTVVGLRGGCL